MNHLYFRLAASEAGLAKGYLFAHGIPAPQVEYRDHSVKVSQSDGGQARHGYKTVSLLWATLTREQGASLRAIVEGAGSTIYASFPRGNGAGEGWDFIDVSGKPQMPDMAPDDTLAGRQTWIYQNVQLVINNLTIINQPASF